MHISLMPVHHRTDMLVSAPVTSFASLRPFFAEHKIVTDKEQAPVFTPAEFTGLKHRDKHGIERFNTGSKDVLRIHFGVFDFDKSPPDRIMQHFRNFSGIECIAYTTFSHGINNQPKVRLLVSLSRPVNIEEWPLVWDGLSKLVQNDTDQKCSDPRRVYFFPSASPDRRAFHFSTYWQGTIGANALNVDWVKSLGSPIINHTKVLSKVITNESLSTRELTNDDLLDLASELRRDRKAGKKRIGRVLSDQIVQGLVYAKQGDCDNTLYQLCYEIAERYPNASAQSVVKLFEKSLGAAAQAYGSDANKDCDKVVEKFTRLQQDKQLRLAGKLEEHNDLVKHNIREAFKMVGVDRDQPYTNEELLSYAEKLGVSLREMRKRWILTYGRGCFVFVGGRYLTAIPKEDLPVVARRDLSPAITAGVGIGEEESGLKDIKQLLAEYSTPARKSICSFTLQETFYDPSTQTIYEASCPLRNLEPKYFPWVDCWLRLLGGEKAEKLLDWISVITFLENPATVLYLKGPKGIGKSSFGHGLAKLWVNIGATALAEAFESWNEVVARCPLLFADEVLPETLRRSPSTVLREFQQSVTRQIKRKYLPSGDAQGAVRIIIAANNDAVLHTEEDLTIDDLEALAQRLLYITPDDRLPDFMKQLADGGLNFGQEVYQNNALAHHALWLRETRSPSVLARGQRFFVQDNEKNEIVNTLITQAGSRSPVIQWMVAYLQEPAIAAGLVKDKVFVFQGRLYISPQAIHDAWECYMRGARVMSAKRIGQALEALSEGPARVLPLRGQDSVSYYMIKTEHLINWAKRLGFSSELQIRALLAKDTKMSEADSKALHVYNNRTASTRVVDTVIDLGLYRARGLTN